MFGLRTNRHNIAPTSTLMEWSNASGNNVLLARFADQAPAAWSQAGMVLLIAGLVGRRGMISHRESAPAPQAAGYGHRPAWSWELPAWLGAGAISHRKSAPAPQAADRQSPLGHGLHARVLTCIVPNFFAQLACADGC